MLMTRKLNYGIKYRDFESIFIAERVIIKIIAGETYSRDTFDLII